MCLIVAKAMGASQVIITGKQPLQRPSQTQTSCGVSCLSSILDLFPERLALAKELGADFQLKVSGKLEPKQLAKSAEDMLGVQPQVAIECTGVESSIQTAIYVRDGIRAEL